MNFNRLQPTYVSLRIANSADGTNSALYDAVTSSDNFINASIRQVFNAPVITNADDYVVAVERMELSINGIPFYLASGEQIIVHQRAPPNATTVLAINESAYSLSQFLTILNAKTFVDPSDNSNFNVVFTITKEGFISFTLLGGKTFNNLFFEFPRKINLILGISTVLQVNGTVVSSQTSRLDCGDNLQHIVLQSNLQTISDVIGNVPLQVLTDFAPESSYSNSLSYAASGALQQSAFSTNLRQKVIYNPNEKRYLDLISAFGIQSINIDAFSTNLDGDYSIIPLPLGSSFDIKLGFYKKL